MAYFLIDGMYLTHRSYHGNPGLTTSSEMPSGAFFGYLRTLVALRKQFPHEKFAVCWDSRTNFRKEIDPNYKGGRGEALPGFWEQKGDIEAALSALGVDQWSCENYEADDVFAAFVNRFREQGLITIYTCDKDMLQLVKDGRVIVMRPGTRGTPDQFYDEGKVKERFGVAPEHLVHYRALDGDSSDNLPGVPRVPRKVLAKLVNRFHTLGNVFCNLDKEKLTSFQKEGILSFQETAQKNYKLMTLEGNLPHLTLTHDAQDPQKFEYLLEKYEISPHTIAPDTTLALFRAELNIRHSDPVPVLRVETEDIFGDE